MPSINQDSTHDPYTKGTDADWLAQLADSATREDAANRIFQKYAEQLLKLIDNRLNESLQRRAEPLDIMQSVWKSFFSRKFELRDKDSLFPLLAEMCVRKSAGAARRHSAHKRAVASEATLDFEDLSAGVRPSLRSNELRMTAPKRNETASENAAPEKQDDSSLDVTTCQMMVKGATPEQAAVAIELFESLSSELQEIMRLKLEGFNDEEVAGKVGCTRRTVVRKTDLIRSHLRKRVLDD